MFSSSSLPGIVSLFSSTSSDPLALFSAHSDESLPADSFVHLLLDSTSEPPPPAPRTLIVPHPVPSTNNDARDALHKSNYELTQTVLHLQSPTLRTTYVRCPPERWHTHMSDRSRDLGLKHPWLHLQVRNLGRTWSFEVGLVDVAGRQGIVRCSTFQVLYSFGC